MSINLKQFEESILHGAIAHVVHVDSFRALKSRLEEIDDVIDNAKLAEVTLPGGNRWSIQNNEPIVAEALDELSDKILDAICALEIAQRKAQKDAEWYYRNAQRKIFFDDTEED